MKRQSIGDNSMLRGFNVYYLLSIAKVIKSRGMRLEWHVACIKSSKRI
jgi:hypothetical protein